MYIIMWELVAPLVMMKILQFSRIIPFVIFLKKAATTDSPSVVVVFFYVYFLRSFWRNMNLVLIQLDRWIIYTP